jgi:hypothetical protein
MKTITLLSLSMAPLIGFARFARPSMDLSEIEARSGADIRGTVFDTSLDSASKPSVRLSRFALLMLGA